MNPWETCVATALMGVDRQSAPLDLSHPALNSYDLTSLSPADRLLSIAGLLTAYRNSHYRVDRDFQFTTGMGWETLKVCSGAAAQYCRSILLDKPPAQSRQLLPELLHLLSQQQQTVPPTLLPALLDWGQREAAFRPLILPVLGTRGQWLAQQNPQWTYGNYAADQLPDFAELQNAWETGNNLERQTALRTWRAHQPNEARQALGRCWLQEKAGDRQTWLSILEIGLSQEDEEFLEKALSDRAVGVRQQAAQLLGRMPSRYRRRIGQIAIQWLLIEGSEGGCKAQVFLPKTAQPEWLEEGLSDKVPKDHPIASDVPSWLLLQVLGATDLHRWGADLDVTPEILIAAILNLRHHNALILSGWATAAIQQRRVDWITALLDRAGNSLSNSCLFRLLKALPTANLREKYLVEFLAKDSAMTDRTEMLLPLLAAEPAPWGSELSQVILAKISYYLAKSGDRWQPEDREFHQLLAMGGYHFHPEALTSLTDWRDSPQERLSQRLPDHQRRHQTALEDCIETLEFCRGMRLAFSEKN
jgi:Family of unknown function (DUF5691)